MGDMLPVARRISKVKTGPFHGGRASPSLGTWRFARAACAGHGDAPPTEVDGAPDDRMVPILWRYAVQTTYARTDQVLPFKTRADPVAVQVAAALG